MWVEFKKVENLTAARAWKELFEDEGIPTRILTVSGEAPGREAAEYRVLVPNDKKHVIEEALRRTQDSRMPQTTDERLRG